MRKAPQLLTVLVGLALYCSIGLSYAQDNSAADLLTEYREIYQQHLANPKLGLVPLYSSTNYRIGDVWDPTMTRLLEGADHCFPGITLRSSPDSIAALTYSKEAAAGFLFGLKKLFSASGSGSLSHSVKVTFTNVQEQVVSEGDLQRTFSPTNCPKVASIVGLGKVETNGLVGVVIGRLYFGQRHIEITYGDAAEAAARADDIAAIAAGANVSIEVNGKLSNSRSVTMADTAPAPLGFSPAFLPLLVGTTMGGQGNDAEYAWRAFDPIENPSQLEAISELAEAVASEWSWHDSD